MKPLTPAQLSMLRIAATRRSGLLFPSSITNGPASDLVLEALQRKGLATTDAAPVITAAGRAALSSHQDKTGES